jgi:flagellar hook protein FlgE
VLQGWAIDNSTSTALASSGASSTTTSGASAIKGAGQPRDIRLEGFTAEPKATENVTMVTNLDARDGGDNSALSTDKFFSMFQIWDGQEETPLGETRFAYQNSIKVYDEGGTAHTLTVYFDQVTVSDAGGYRYWEYMVTVNPTEDGRVIDARPWPTPACGQLVMIGTMTFDTSGQLKNMSAFTLASSATGDLGSLANWTPAQFNTNGQPVFTANFTGLTSASGTAESNARNIGINFGLTNANTSAGWATGGAANAAAIGTDPTLLPEFASVRVNADATTNYSGSSSTQIQSQDGYTFGFLQNVSVDSDGLLTGRYSNGVVMELVQVTLYDFHLQVGLQAQRLQPVSRDPRTGRGQRGPANANGYGSISSNSAGAVTWNGRGFVQMISPSAASRPTRRWSPRGRLLQTVIQMKRLPDTQTQPTLHNNRARGRLRGHAVFRTHEGPARRTRRARGARDGCAPPPGLQGLVHDPLAHLADGLRQAQHLVGGHLAQDLLARGVAHLGLDLPGLLVDRELDLHPDPGHEALHRLGQPQEGASAFGFRRAVFGVGLVVAPQVRLLRALLFRSSGRGARAAWCPGSRDAVTSMSASRSPPVSMWSS